MKYTTIFVNIIVGELKIVVAFDMYLKKSFLIDDLDIFYVNQYPLIVLVVFLVVFEVFMKEK